MFVCLMYIGDTYYLMNRPGSDSGIASWETAEAGQSYLSGYIGDSLKRVTEVVIPSFVEIDGLDDMLNRIFGEKPPHFIGSEIYLAGITINVVHVNQELAKQEWLEGNRERFH